MARFDAVLFDLDGTLLDSVALILESFHHVLETEGLPARSDAEILAGLGTTLEAQFRRWVGDEARVPGLVDAYIAHNLARHDALVRPYPGVSELVRDLHGAGTPLAVVTSKRRRGAEMGLRALGLAGYFTLLVCGDEVDRPKPDPQPVRMALDALGASAGGTIFVGDATHDVLAGRAAGVATIAVTWGAAEETALREVRPDHLARDASALRALVV